MQNGIWMRLSMCAAALLAASGAIVADDQNPRTKQEDGNSPLINAYEINALAGAPTNGSTGQMSPLITRHNGPVMSVSPRIYLIWYGSWSQTNNSDTPAGQALVKTFLADLNNSPYFLINTSYGATGGVGAVSETTVTAARNSSLSDKGVLNVVTSVINSNVFGAANPNGVYFVLTSSDIAKSGFCTSYCGWHTRATIKGVDVKYSFVGNANRCLSSCAPQTIGPNGNAGVDGMLSVLAHELEETVTDPDLNAWYDSKGAENADKCAWTFGQSQSSLASGAYYNMTMNNHNYLIQRNLSATDSKCYVSAGAQ
jgi:hypothetical protein